MARAWPVVESASQTQVQGHSGAPQSFLPLPFPWLWSRVGLSAVIESHPSGPAGMSCGEKHRSFSRHGLLARHTSFDVPFAMGPGW